jgi:hypothetical protein
MVPTAALVSVGGRVTTAGGNGIRNAHVILANHAGEIRTTITGSFGYFRFGEVAAGETYILTLRSKHYQFSNGTRVLFVAESVNDILFIADW